MKGKINHTTYVGRLLSTSWLYIVPGRLAKTEDVPGTSSFLKFRDDIFKTGSIRQPWQKKKKGTFANYPTALSVDKSSPFANSSLSHQAAISAVSYQRRG